MFYIVMNPKDADGMANSVDPDQVAPLKAPWPRLFKTNDLVS